MPIAGSPHHSIEWQRPAGLKRPQLLNVAIAKLRDPAMQRASFALTKVYYRKSGATKRYRRARADGMTNCMSLMMATVASCDIMRGFVARPVGNTGAWDRPSAAALGRRAYGPPIPDEVSSKRTERHLRHLAALGWITVKEITVQTAKGPRARVAVKHVTDYFWAVFGLKAKVGEARRERSREKAAGRLQQVTQVLRDALPIKRVRDTRSEEQEEYRIAEENRQKVIDALARLRLHDPPK